MRVDFSKEGSTLGISLYYGETYYWLRVLDYEEGDLGLTFANSIDPHDTDGVVRWREEGYARMADKVTAMQEHLASAPLSTSLQAPSLPQTTALGRRENEGERIAAPSSLREGQDEPPGRAPLKAPSAAAGPADRPGESAVARILMEGAPVSDEPIPFHRSAPGDPIMVLTWKETDLTWEEIGSPWEETGEAAFILGDALRADLGFIRSIARSDWALDDPASNVLAPRSVDLFGI